MCVPRTAAIDDIIVARPPPANVGQLTSEKAGRPPLKTGKSETTRFLNDIE